PFATDAATHASDSAAAASPRGLRKLGCKEGMPGTIGDAPRIRQMRENPALSQEERPMPARPSFVPALVAASLLVSIGAAQDKPAPAAQDKPAAEKKAPA